jgi:hypothetical protein
VDDHVDRSEQPFEVDRYGGCVLRRVIDHHPPVEAHHSNAEQPSPAVRRRSDMPAVQHRAQQHSRPDARHDPAPEADVPASAIPVQRGHPEHAQVAADDRWVEALRTGGGGDADDPVIRALAQWRARIVEGT